MINRASIRWHLLGWLGYVGYQVIGLFIAHKISPERGWVLLSAFSAEVVEFYLCYLLIFPRLLRPGHLTKLITALLGVVALYIGLRYGIEEVLYPRVLGFHNYTLDTPTNHIFFYSVYFALPAIAASAALWAGQATLRRERENQQLRSEKRVAEIAFLKTQINPHFLYNTLNLLYGMAYSVSKPLAAAQLKLAELMRYMLHEGADGQVDLSQEIAYLHNYLALYRLRFPEQLFVDFTVSGHPAGHRIAPLLLIPFVENAFKHGVLDNPATPVCLQLTINAGELGFTVKNHITTDSHKDTTSGIGLPNLRRRLALLYPGRYTLHIAAESGQFITLLRLVA